MDIKPVCGPDGSVALILAPTSVPICKPYPLGEWVPFNGGHFRRDGDIVTVRGTVVVNPAHHLKAAK